jgi:glutathione S-transferase
VLRIGADVYCDTACIVRVIEARHPEPTVFPAGQEGAGEMLAWWVERQVFPVAAALVLASLGATLPSEFKADREAMVPGLKIDALPPLAPHARSQLRAFCDAIDRQLVRKQYLLGSAFSVADAAYYHTLWFARMDASAAAIMAAYPHLGAWFSRIEGLDGGEATPLAPDEALAIAKASTPAPAAAGQGSDPSGVRTGQRVTVTPDDYAFDPVAGEVVALGVHEIAIRRSDAAVGDVVVHFPRAGYRVTPA